MKGKMLRYFVLVALTCQYPLLCSGAHEDGLAPSEVRWHFFGDEISNAFVGRDGRCFYLRRGEPVSTLSLSETGVVAAGFRPILFDRCGRLWCVGPRGAALYSLKGNTVAKTKPADAVCFDTIDQVGGARRVHTAAYEDSAGRLWFGDSRGVRWLDGERWSHKTLADPNSLEVSLPMSTLYVAEDTKARLYFWARWTAKSLCGTNGFWMFDGADWTHYGAAQGLADNRLEAVCPLGGDVVLVNTAGGRLVRFSTKKVHPAAEVARLVRLLDHDKWGVRQNATEALRLLGRRIELELKKHLTNSKEPEVRSRIKMVLTALRQSAHGQQRLPGSGYVCESARIRTPHRRRRPRKPWWLVEAKNVTDTNTGKELETAAFLLSAEGMTMIKGWPGGAEEAQTSVLPDGDGGLWIGLNGRGLFHWDGRKTREVPGEAAGDYTEILGRDSLGRIILTNGTAVAAYRPRRREQRRQPMQSR